MAICVAGLTLLAFTFFYFLLAAHDAAAGRVVEVAAAIRADGPAALDAAMLATNDQVVAVQVVDDTGHVVARSAGAPATPLVSVTSFGPDVMDEPLRDGASPNDDMWLNGQQVQTSAGRFTIIVGAGSASIESGILTTGLFLAVAAAVVTAAAAAAGYILVRRSLGPVEAIRTQVAAITAAGLQDRIPVPAQRDEIFRLAETMNSMLERIEAGNRAQRQFVGDASHELRSPLATIISALEVAEAHPSLLDAQMTQRILLPEARRMRTMVDDLLLLARADEFGLTVPSMSVDLQELVAAEAARLRYTSPLTVLLSNSPACVRGDRDALMRLIRNVLDNAVRHTNSLIEVAVHRCGATASVVIGDDGPGIPASDRARVFDRFVRLDSDRSRRGGGTGLGLAIAAEIAASHGGAIEISERDAGGALVTITLPVGNT